MSEDRDPVIRVKDRRMFNPDGTLRDNIPEEREEPEAPAPAPAPPPAEPAARAEPAPAPEGRPEPRAASEPEPPPQRPGDPTLFSDLVVNLASQAAMYMGLVDNPLGPKLPTDMQAARQMIEILAMLRDKTQGNLTSDEGVLLERILTDLRMQYVSMAATRR